MKTSSVTFYSTGYRETRTYLAAALFAAGNIVLPQLCHLVQLGGPTMLPIYFFTLVGAYKYGWRTGLLTALASPLVNAALFGMPAVTALPAILVKSALLAGAAGYAARRFNRVSVALLAAVVLFYQIVGSAGEWALTGSFTAAVQDFRIGIPGMLLQVLLHLHCPAVLVGVRLIHLNYSVGDQGQVLLPDSKVVHQPLVQPRGHCKGGSHHQGGGNKGHKAPLHSSLHGLLLSFRSVQSVQHGHLLLLSRGDLIKHPAQVKVIHGIPPPELLSVFFVPGPARCGQ